jgi:hypothetical protein
MIIAGISYLWTNPDAYNFASSEWGGLVFKIFYAIVLIVFVRWLIKPLTRKINSHMQCEVPECKKWGHIIYGTSHRACREHHPHLSPDGHTPEEMAHAAKYGHNTTIGDHK